MGTDDLHEWLQEDALPDLTNKLRLFFESQPLIHLKDDATEMPGAQVALDDLRRSFAAFSAIYENVQASEL